MSAIKDRLHHIKKRSDELETKVPKFAKLLPDVKEANILLTELFALAFDLAKENEVLRGNNGN